jgi:hypothetical protein
VTAAAAGRQRRLTGCEIVPGSPLNGAIRASFSAPMMHVPVDEPENGAPTVTLEMDPLASNVIAAVD